MSGKWNGLFSLGAVRWRSKKNTAGSWVRKSLQFTYVLGIQTDHTDHVNIKAVLLSSTINDAERSLSQQGKRPSFTLSETSNRQRKHWDVIHIVSTWRWSTRLMVSGYRFARFKTQHLSGSRSSACGRQQSTRRQKELCIRVQLMSRAAKASDCRTTHTDDDAYK